MKKLILAIITLVMIFAFSAKAVTLLQVPQGGTGAGTLTGVVVGNGTGAFTTNSTGALTSDLNFDSNTFVISYDDNKVGIGTTTPTYALHVTGSIQTDTNFYGDTWMSSTGNSMAIQPTGDADDFFSFKTPANRPTIKREGGKFIYIESTNIYDAGIAIRDGDTHSGTFAFEKDTNRMSLSAKGSPLIMKLNSDYDDYFLFQTTSNVPEMTIVGAADLKINAGGANALLLNHAGGNVAVGATSTSYILGLGTGDTFGIGTTQWNSADEIDGTKIKDADYGDVVIDAAGDWQVSEATALSANGANCGAGQSPLGVDASGAVESCFDVWTEAENTAAGYISATLTEEQVEDFTGGMLGGTETHIAVTYQDITNDIDFVVSDDWWNADGDIAIDTISESKIAFSTACGAGNHYYLNGNDLACEANTTDTTIDGCTNCLNATEIEDIYALNSGDTMTGRLTVTETSAGALTTQVRYLNSSNTVGTGGRLSFRMLDSNSAIQTYGRVATEIDVNTAGSEDGTMRMSLIGGGVFDDILVLNGSSKAATFAGAVTGSNLSGSNTGDQDISGYMQDTDIDTFAELTAWAVGYTDNNTTYVSSDFTHDDLTGFVANEHLDWTGDLGAVNIHAGNYTDTNTTYVSSDWTLSDITGYMANEHIDWTADQGATNIHTGNYTAGLTNLTDFDQTAWRLFYSNNLGDVIELSLGTNGQYLQSQGGTSSLTWSTPTDTTANETITLSGDVTGSGTTALTVTVGADKILESHLKSVNAATDEYCLTYEATTGDFEWQTCGGSLAINDITDITIDTPADNEVLAYNNGTSTWLNQTPAEAGLQGVLTNSAGLLVALNDETGTGLSVFSTSPTFTTGITVPNDSISAAELNEGDAFAWTSTHDFGGATSLELVNNATPTTDATGEIALDTTITDHQPLLQYYDGGENMSVIAIDTAELPALDDEIIKYDAATDKFVLEADAGGAGGDVGGLYGINVETLSADKTLTVDSNKIYQYLDEGGANRIITLATAGASAGDRFIVRHNGLFYDTNYLQINQAAIILDKIYAGAIKEFIFDGTNWVSGENGSGEDDTKKESVAIGYSSNGSNRGTVIGYSAKGIGSGVAIGHSTDGGSSGVAIGNFADGGNKGVAIGSYTNTNFKKYSVALGYYSETERYSEIAHCIDGSTTQDYNMSSAGWAIQTANATPVEMFLGEESNRRFTINPESVVSFTIRIAARDNVANEVASYKIEGLIKRDGAGNTVLVWSNKTVQYEDDASWDVAVTADDTNEALIITVTGDGTNPVRFAGRIDEVETQF